MPLLEIAPERGLRPAYGTWTLTSRNRRVKNLLKAYEAEVHGDRTWDASYLLMDYLLARPPRKRSRVLELGCGWGPGSVFCAQRFASRVTAVDRDPNVFPYLELAAELNEVRVKTLESPFEDLSRALLGRQELIIGSDICFWEELVRPLARVIGRALRNGARRVVITDPGRQPFLDLGDRLGRRFQVDVDPWYASDPGRFEGFVMEVRPK